MKKYLSRLVSALLALILLTAPASALTVDQALELLEENYYYGLPDEAYQAESLEQLFALLGDPYTYYMTAEEYAALLDLTENEVSTVGVGVILAFTDQGLLVDTVLPESSAQAAGVQPGDLIVSVDGASCVPASQDHLDLLRGQEDTQVSITLRRGDSTLSLSLTRRALVMRNTRFTLLGEGLGYLQCTSFGLDTGALFTQLLQEHDEEVDCWVIDLRGNSGGYVNSALDMLGALNGPDYYLYFEEYDGRTLPYGSNAEAATGKPVILLVDGASASASELLSAGVRDLDRGLVVGSRTFGKGVAQTLFDEETHPEYFEGDSLRITTDRFYAAAGTTTDRVGVIPTLLVDDAMAPAVVQALCGGSMETSSLCVMPGSDPFYVDPDADPAVLAALLEALPPQMRIFYNGGVYTQCSAPEAAAGMGVSYNSRWFTDVADSCYAGPINAMATYRLLNGTQPGVFSPKEQLTRAQLCVMLARVLNVTYSGPSLFTDVADGAWYAGEVNAMAVLGLVSGVGGELFNPESPLTQEEFLAIMGRTARYLNFAMDAYGYAVEQAGEDLPLDMQAAIAPYSDWAQSSVAVLTWGLQDVLDGAGSMLFAPLYSMDPSAPILREEAAAGMYAVLSGLEILP